MVQLCRQGSLKTDGMEWLQVLIVRIPIAGRIHDVRFYFQATPIFGHNTGRHRRRMPSTSRSLCTRRMKVNHLGLLATWLGSWHSGRAWTRMLVLIVTYARLAFALLEVIHSLRSTLDGGNPPPDLEPVVSLLQTTQAQYRASARDGSFGWKVDSKTEH